VAVLNDRNLIVVSARGNITPLLELASTNLHENGAFLARF
jgi:hypothetical protein